MATDFTYNNKTINSSGPIKPSGKNQPLDPRTEVKLYADIESIPSPYIGMIITVLEDETNSNKMTDYKVLSLKADSYGVANSAVDQVQRYVDYLGASSGGSVSQEDINTAVNNYLTEHPVSSGATVEQAAQIEANKTAIGDSNSGLIKEVTDVKNLLGNESLDGQSVQTVTGVINELSREIEDIINIRLSGKYFVFKTNSEYESLSESEKNDPTKVYIITDLYNSSLTESQEAAINLIGTGDLNTNSKKIIPAINELKNRIDSISSGGGGTPSQPIPITSIELRYNNSPDNFTLNSRGTYQLTTITEPASGYTDTITYESNNTDAVSVSSQGIITVKNNGEATITATASSGINDSIIVTISGLTEINELMQEEGYNITRFSGIEKWSTSGKPGQTYGFEYCTDGLPLKLNDANSIEGIECLEYPVVSFSDWKTNVDTESVSGLVFNSKQYIKLRVSTSKLEANSKTALSNYLNSNNVLIKIPVSPEAQLLTINENSNLEINSEINNSNTMHITAKIDNKYPVGNCIGNKFNLCPATSALSYMTDNPDVPYVCGVSGNAGARVLNFSLPTSEVGTSLETIRAYLSSNPINFYTGV